MNPKDLKAINFKISKLYNELEEHTKIFNKDKMELWTKNVSNTESQQYDINILKQEINKKCSLE